MLTTILIAQDATVPNGTLADSGLLDGASLYGAEAFDRGQFAFAFNGAHSEGLVFPYGQGAPDLGNFEIADGVKGIGYEDQWDLTGASSPTTYSVISGALPDGLTLESVSGNTGRIYGTPTVAGTFNFTLRATNVFGLADQAFTIVVVAAPGGGSYAFIS